MFISPFFGKHYNTHRKGEASSEKTNQPKLKFKFYINFHCAYRKLNTLLGGLGKSVSQEPHHFYLWDKKFIVWSVVNVLSFRFWFSEQSVELSGFSAAFCKSEVWSVWGRVLCLPVSLSLTLCLWLSSVFHLDDSSILWVDWSPGTSPSGRQGLKFHEAPQGLGTRGAFQVRSEMAKAQGRVWDPLLLAFALNTFSCLYHCYGHHILIQGVNAEWVQEPQFIAVILQLLID